MQTDAIAVIRGNCNVKKFKEGVMQSNTINSIERKKVKSHDQTPNLDQNIAAAAHRTQSICEANRNVQNGCGGERDRAISGQCRGSADESEDGRVGEESSGFRD